MLGIVTNVFGHQESIAPISLTFNANNSWFKVALAIFQEKKNDIFQVILIFFKYMSIMM